MASTKSPPRLIYRFVAQANYGRSHLAISELDLSCLIWFLLTAISDNLLSRTKS